MKTMINSIVYLKKKRAKKSIDDTALLRLRVSYLETVQFCPLPWATLANALNFVSPSTNCWAAQGDGGKFFSGALANACEKL